MKRVAVISPDATGEMLKNLGKLDISPIIIPRTPRVAKPLEGHPDMQLFPHNSRCYCHPDISVDFLRELEGYCEIIICGTELKPEHPGDIPYNIASVGSMAFHRRRYTEPGIMDALEKEGSPVIDVRQGYAKCSTMVTGYNRIVTSDRSIHAAAKEERIKSLLITPGFVCLPGYSYGFLGGATGLTDDHLLMTGRIDAHPDRESIYEFIEGSGKRITFLSHEEAVDLGSIFVLQG